MVLWSLTIKLSLSLLASIDSLVGSAPTYSAIVLLRASRGQIPTRGRFPISPHISLLLRFLSVLICLITIKGKYAFKEKKKFVTSQMGLSF